MERAAFLLGLTSLTVLPELAAADGKLVRLDVHHHCMPAFFPDAVKPRPINGPVSGWSVEKSFSDMEKAGVMTAILSMPRTPPVYFGGVDASRALARKVNEAM